MNALNGIESLLSDLFLRVQDESLNSANISAYIARINVVVRSIAALHNPRLSELVPALQDVSIALQQCDENNSQESNLPPSRVYTGIYIHIIFIIFPHKFMYRISTS